MSVLHQPATADARWPVGERPPAIRELRSLTWLPIAAMAALLVLTLAAPAAAAAVAVPVAVVGALLGIPHGAVDHLVPWWWGPTASPGAGTPGQPAHLSRRGLGLFAVGYAAFAALALAGLLLFPTPMIAAFLLLSAAHFGRGEVVTSAERAGRRTPGLLHDWPVASAYGLVVVGPLLWSTPPRTDPFLRPLSAWLADAVLRSRGPGLVVVAGAVAVGLGLLLRSRRRVEAVELMLLGVTFAIAPPLAAFGVYFGCWHAVRHTGRLLDLAQRQCTRAGSSEGSWSPAVALVARASIGPTLIAISVVGGLWWARDLASLQAEVAVLLALTFPHAAVVWALDRRESRQRQGSMRDD